MAISLEFESSGENAAVPDNSGVSVFHQRLIDARCSYEMALDTIADGIISAENLSSRIYRRVHNAVLKYEQKALKYLIAPPRAASFLIEAQMGSQLITSGHIDHTMMSIWVLNKAISWLPLTCALFPETTSRRVVSRALHHAGQLYWHPQTELPILTNKIVEKTEEAFDRTYSAACLIHSQPGYVARRIVDKSLDSAYLWGERAFDGMQRIGESLGHDAPQEIYIDTTPVLIEERKLY